MGRVELPSQPWEGHIIAAIRHPLVYKIITPLPDGDNFSTIK